MLVIISVGYVCADASAVCQGVLQRQEWIRLIVNGASLSGVRDVEDEMDCTIRLILSSWLKVNVDVLETGGRSFGALDGLISALLFWVYFTCTLNALFKLLRLYSNIM